MSAWTLIYDGDCAFCRGCVAWLARRGRGAPLRFVPLQAEAELATLPPIPPAALTQAMHLVAPDGSVTAGAAAAPQLLRLLPWGRPLAALFRVPGVPALAALAYRTVARHRRRLAFGLPTSCAAEPLSGGPSEGTLPRARRS